MSWRESIPEIAVLPFLINLLNGVGLSLSNAKSQKANLDSELEDIERELEDLIDRTQSSFKTLTGKKEKEVIDTESRDDDDKESKIDRLAQNLEERKLGGQELNFVVVRRTELLRRKAEIIAIEKPKVVVLEKLAEARFNNTRQLLPRLKNIQTSLDTILTSLDNLIQSVSGIPVTGPVIASVLNTILDIIEQKLYLPLKTALVLWEQSLDAIRLVFFEN